MILLLFAYLGFNIGIIVAQNVTVIGHCLILDMIREQEYTSKPFTYISIIST